MKLASQASSPGRQGYFTLVTLPPHLGENMQDCSLCLHPCYLHVLSHQFRIQNTRIHLNTNGDWSVFSHSRTRTNEDHSWIVWTDEFLLSTTTNYKIVEKRSLESASTTFLLVLLISNSGLLLLRVVGTSQFHPSLSTEKRNFSPATLT